MQKKQRTIKAEVERAAWQETAELSMMWRWSHIKCIVAVQMQTSFCSYHCSTNQCNHRQQSITAQYNNKCLWCPL